MNHTDHVLRVRRIPVSFRRLVDLLREGTRYPLTMAGLPEDATFVRAYPDWSANCFWLEVWSETFDPVPENVIPPALFVKVTREGFVPDDDPPLERPAVAERFETIEAGSFLLT